MGLVCYLFVTRGLNHTHQVDVSSLKAMTDVAPNDKGFVPMTGRSTFNSRHRHDLIINASGKGRLEVNKATGTL